MKLATHNAAIVFAVIQIMKQLGYALGRVTTPDDFEVLPSDAIDSHATVVRVVRNVSNYDCDTQLDFNRGSHCAAQFGFDFLDEPSGYVYGSSRDAIIQPMFEAFSEVMIMLDYGPTARISGSGRNPRMNQLEHREWSMFADYVRGMVLLGHMAMGPKKWQPGDVAYDSILTGVRSLVTLPDLFEV